MMFGNHITGGLVFTGTFCSLFEVNIFESPISIGIVLIGSIIPDIDHTKSIIGKVFYPISKMISIKYGHRTITHSLLFLILTTVIFLLSEKYLFDSSNYTLIYFFALLSHLLLDMITVQGIPLFYPFARNPCVIPANPELRIKTNNLKSEGIAMFVFSLLTIFLQPLFANGFWTTYNNQFNTITHVFREFTSSKNAIKIEYDYTFYNQDIYGEGILVKANSNSLSLISNNKLHQINNNPNTIIKELKIIKTDSILLLDNLVFNNIELDSLDLILKNRFIIEGDIFSNNKILYNGKTANHYNLKNVYNSELPSIIEEENKEKKNIENKIVSIHT